MKNNKYYNYYLKRNQKYSKNTPRINISEKLDIINDIEFKKEWIKGYNNE